MLGAADYQFGNSTTSRTITEVRQHCMHMVDCSSCTWVVMLTPEPGKIWLAVLFTRCRLCIDAELAIGQCRVGPCTQVVAYTALGTGSLEDALEVGNSSRPPFVTPHGSAEWNKKMYVVHCGFPTQWSVHPHHGTVWRGTLFQPQRPWWALIMQDNRILPQISRFRQHHGTECGMRNGT